MQISFYECKAYYDNQHTIRWNICHQSHHPNDIFAYFEFICLVPASLFIGFGNVWRRHQIESILESYFSSLAKLAAVFRFFASAARKGKCLVESQILFDFLSIGCSERINQSDFLIIFLWVVINIWIFELSFYNLNKVKKESDIVVTLQIAHSFNNFLPFQQW